MLILELMPEEEDFFITYQNTQIKVSPVINGGNIYFIIHFKEPITIAEGLVNESWGWYEMNTKETLLATELGEIIEAVDIN
ncbi:hypothetical protein FRZ67_04595 [Panacibacter ginsenosidivorans]|uniref:Uncharacterized protein n=1 Tax=Panacibacter ginsenosidivorans TaxID=1813871 RepID=A0A5B8V759_9BACT|nr:hypothetical protein [Panacibacter ginsenosidivorans]QEC66611.1 hypothetical protein FRZ67_04595 [Panacibacter ginsenosidivorans]